VSGNVDDDGGNDSNNNIITITAIKQILMLMCSAIKTLQATEVEMVSTELLKTN
jgi:hypothetical protein